MSKKTIRKQLNNLYSLTSPSFAEGMARVLDIGSTMQTYNESLSPEEADKEAIKKDWQIIGKDIKNSIHAYEQQPANI